jgi:CopG family nickel-responsive transcriptional regulator
MGGVSRFSISLKTELLEKFNRLLKEKGYGSRSEAIRDLIREKLVEERWRKGGEVVGSLTLVYDHETRGVADKLTDLQHHHAENMVSSMHVHLTERSCMEVLVLRGNAEAVKKIAEELLSSRGVKHGKLVVTCLPEEL